jgi:tol-pal system protein YbgF
MSARSIRVILAALALGAALVTGAAAQSERELGEMRLYVRQLEEQVRQLTGEVERLRHQVQVQQGGSEPQLQTGQAPQAELQWQTVQPGGEPQWRTGQQTWQTEVIIDDRGAGAPGVNSSAEAGAPPSQLGSISVAQDDPRIAPDGDPGQAGTPLDLSALAGGSAGPGFDGLRGSDQSAPVPLPDTIGAPQQRDWSQLGQEAQAAPQMAALGGSANDQYDLAYGYILTGDYGLAEAGFRQWLQTNAGHPLAGDAEFWLAESMLRQDKHREAANLFLKVYKAEPQGRKAPDSLAKLGMALAALGEQSAACATFQELGRKHPDASELVRSQVAAASQRAGC